MNQKRMMQLSIFVVFFFMFLLAGWYYFSQQKQAVSTVVERDYDYIMQHDPIGQNAKAPTHYYTFVLSWSPAFCDIQRKRYGENLPNSLKYQCGKTQQFGWVIHGLWPQNKFARRVSDQPRFCQGDLPMVKQEVIEQFLAESPSANLLQGEWEKHGACAFDKAQDYFAKQQELFHTLKFPAYELSSRNELFAWMKKNNPQLKNIYIGASRNELFICYDLSWQVIDCPRSRTGY
ncbi:ribonuclease T2 family protein [Necropsobacter massiliensis]|uniref:ribonuclease T2 family protein n=1 Tax=Necropsobacter massiliensis TaxID=1400001 RepID=UPI000595D201|nr:ribonuclease T [Necropsobacter massiliensis]